MTPETLAALHAQCFAVPRPFSAEEFRSYLTSDICFLLTCNGGFALGRAIVDEAELITLAVDPARRRQGLGRTLLRDFEAEAQRRGAERAFLEVAASNRAAARLYQASGYRQTGVRKRYYRLSGGQAENALVLEKALKRD